MLIPLTRLVRFLLLLLFVLLQCVAPLAHAHVNNGHGDNDGQGVHIDRVEHPWLNDHDHEADSAHLSDDEHHSAVVSMPPEYRCSALPIDQPQAISRQNLIVQCEHKAVLFIAFHRHNLPLFLCQHPCSQAPPV
jgi:hypothetical protein